MRNPMSPYRIRSDGRPTRHRRGDGCPRFVTGCVWAVIRQEHRAAYYGALAQADAGDLAPFNHFVADELAATMELYLRALRNEPDPDAFSRRVALLKREVDSTPLERVIDSARRSEMARTFVIPLLEKTEERIDRLRPVFQQVSEFAEVIDDSGTHWDGYQAREILRGGAWVSFRYFWRFALLRSDPSFNTSVGYEGLIGDNTFIVRSRHVQPELRYTSSSLPRHGDVQRAIDAAFEPVLAQIEEAVHRKVSK